MKNLLAKLSTYFKSSRKKIAQRKYLAVSAILLAIIVGAIMNLNPGWFSWAVTLPAHLIIILTALARIEDLTDLHLRSRVRRIGLAMVGSGSVVFCMAPFVPSIGDFPTWKAVLLVWGVALTWLTTPSQPPWWKYITGEYREPSQ